MKQILAPAFLVWLATGCGHLSVTQSGVGNGRDGVPFYLPKQEIVVTELGFDTNSASTPNISYRVDLVTKPDYDHCYLVNNCPALFASSTFQLVRDPQGLLVNLSGGSDDQSIQTAQTLLGFASGISAFFSGGDVNPDQAAITRQMDALKQIRDTLASRLETIGKDPNFDGKTFIALEDELSKVNTQIVALEADLKPKPHAQTSPKGVAATRILKPKTVSKVSDDKAVQGEADKLKVGEIGIYLVPQF